MRPIPLAAIILPALASPIFGAAYSVLTIGYVSTGRTTIQLPPIYPLSLNNLGQVSGTYDGPPNPVEGTGPAEHGFRTQPNQPFNSATDDVGQFDVPIFGFIYAEVAGMNNLGQVAGYANTRSGTGEFLTDSTGKIHSSADNLGLPVGANVKFVNDRDQVVGYTAQGIPFRTKPNQPYNAATDNLPTTDLVRISALNNRGQLLGEDLTTGLLFLTAPDGPIDLATDSLPPGAGGTSLNDSGETSFGHINNSGTVAFSQFVNGSGDTAFISENGQTIDLNTLIDPSFDLYLFDVLQINDNGQILARSHDSDGFDSVVLLTPIPEPASLAFILLPAPLLLRRRHSATALSRG